MLINLCVCVRTRWLLLLWLVMKLRDFKMPEHKTVLDAEIRLYATFRLVFYVNSKINSEKFPVSTGFRSDDKWARSVVGVH